MSKRVRKDLRRVDGRHRQTVRTSLRLGSALSVSLGLPSCIALFDDPAPRHTTEATLRPETGNNVDAGTDAGLGTTRNLATQTASHGSIEVSDASSAGTRPDSTRPEADSSLDASQFTSSNTPVPTSSEIEGGVCGPLGDCTTNLPPTASPDAGRTGSSKFADAMVGSCGDNVNSEGEACDDGNLNSDDGCSDVCEVESGWFCPEGKDCAPECGDGKVVGEETIAGNCDDGNKRPGDGCSSECRVEQGYVCASVPSTCEPGCGDGERLGLEQCDDGDQNRGDGCFACRLEVGATCDSRTLEARGCVPREEGADVYALNLCGEPSSLVEACPGDCGNGVCKCVIRVSTAGNDTQNGLSWAQAKRTVQAAINAAANARCEVWVAAGSYSPSDGRATPSPTDTIQMADSVGIYGGFAGTETYRHERDWANHATTFDGGYVKGDDETGVQHVVTGANNGILDGVTVRGGNAGGGCGGGMLNQDVVMSIRNTTFTGNATAGSGGGLCNKNSRVVVTASSLVSNGPSRSGLNRSGAGLALYNDVESVTKLVDTTVSSNSSGINFGVSAIDNHGSLELVGCAVASNFSYGRAAISTSGAFVLRNSTVSSNTAGDPSQNGLGLGVDGGTAIVVGSTFSDHSAGYDNNSPICLKSGSAYVANTQFRNNNALCGAVKMQGGELTAVGNIFDSNAGSGTSGRSPEGILCLTAGKAQLTNNLFVRNSAGSLERGVVDFGAAASGQVANNVFWENTGSAADLFVVERPPQDPTVSISHNTFGVCPADCATSSCSMPYTCERVDPELYGLAQTPYANSSECVNAGDSTSLPVDVGDVDGDGDTTEPIPLDLLGTPRTAGGSPDIGAIEKTY